MENQQKEFKLKIAEFVIYLYSDTVFELEDGYFPFFADIEDKTDITIECILGLPKLDLEEHKQVFEARNDTQKFYTIFSVDNELLFVIYNQQTNEIQQIAYLKPDFKSWKIYSELVEGQNIPLKYPMGPIVMHYMTLTDEAVMMHASCAFDGEKGRMFSGFSGAGKSTMSMIWANSGNQIINDDRIIIRKKEDGFFVYNTPMYYKDYSKVAPLNAIYLISHSPVNKANRLSGALAATRVMAFCIQNNFDKQFIQKRLNFFADLSKQVPVCELGFVPDVSVVQFIKTHES